MIGGCISPNHGSEPRTDFKCATTTTSFPDSVSNSATRGLRDRDHTLWSGSMRHGLQDRMCGESLRIETASCAFPAGAPGVRVMVSGL